MLGVCSGLSLALKGNKDCWTLSTSDFMVHSIQHYLFSTLDNWSETCFRCWADYLELITTFHKWSGGQKFRPKREFCQTGFRSRRLESVAREISGWRSPRDLAGPMASPRLPRPNGPRPGQLSLLPAPRIPSVFTSCKVGMLFRSARTS